MIETARMRAYWLCLPLLLLLATAPADLSAQERRATLTLEEAVSLARRHNPNYLMQKNDEIEAEWLVREAYGAFLPSASSSMSFSYQAEGTPRFGIFTGADLGLSRTPAYYSSGYSLGVGYRLSGASFFQLGQQRANRRAVAARSEAADFTLAAEVTRRYLAVLRAQDGVELAEQELARAEDALTLAQARFEVGAAMSLEPMQAEVEHGQARVALLQARNQLDAEKLRLFETLGIEFEGDVILTTSFEIFEPEWQLEELVARALDRHPQLRAARAAEQATKALVRSARSQYLPTVELNAGISGYTREAGSTDFLLTQARNQITAAWRSCKDSNEIRSRLNPPLELADCDGTYRFTADDEAAIIRQNDVFPFNFSKEPLFAQLRISLPVFQGFSRQRQIETARVASEDALHQRRAEELRTRADVQTAYRSLQSAAEAVRLQSRNRELGEEQLRLARERYRLGAANFMELSDAATIKARADQAYLDAVYGFHESLAALETAVGERLRPAASDRP